MTTEGLLCRENEPFSTHTPLRVGGKAERWIWVYSEEELCALLPTLKKIRWMIHWPFQDIVCRDGGYPGTVIRLAGQFSNIRYNKDSVTLGSAALWAQLSMNYERIFQSWSGSVGGLFEREGSNILKGYSLRLRWLVGKKIIEEELPLKTTSQHIKKKSILLSLTIFGKPRKRKHIPKKSGEIYSIQSKDNLSDIFAQYQLTGIRLKGWVLCTQQPGRMLHLGGGSAEELLILSQGIKERVYKISGKRIYLHIPLIGKENKHVE
jgi:UDP-N-acetylenolpyruvoylglucosamine reductase